MIGDSDYLLDQNPVYEDLKGSAQSQTSLSLQQKVGLNKPAKTTSYAHKFYCIFCTIILIVCLISIILSIVSFLELKIFECNLKISINRI